MLLTTTARACSFVRQHRSLSLDSVLLKNNIKKENLVRIFPNKDDIVHHQNIKATMDRINDIRRDGTIKIASLLNGSSNSDLQYYRDKYSGHVYKYDMSLYDSSNALSHRDAFSISHLEMGMGNTHGYY